MGAAAAAAAAEHTAVTELLAGAARCSLYNSLHLAGIKLAVRIRKNFAASGSSS
jgi:hypothetical protein